MLDNLQNFIFDLDGTLIDSSYQILKCFELAFESCGLEFDKSKLNSNLIGPPLIDIIKNLAPKINDKIIYNRVINTFRNIYDNCKSDESKMYEGSKEFLNYLKNCNCNIFIATFKPKIPTIRLLKKFNIADFFKDIYTIDKFDTVITKEDMIRDILSRYRLNPIKTVMIGDAANDAISAKANNIFSIAALWGYGSDKSKLIDNSDFVFSSFFEITNNLNLKVCK